MTSAAPTPTKVAIVGGGCGALTAAFELTRPEHGGRFAVTVYQEGWRLGGKGASGRGPAGRIEEHGLHVWLGFYDNAFALMRACYAELAAGGCDDYGAWHEAFHPEADIGLFGAAGPDHGWHNWRGHFAPRPGLPGDPVDPRDVHSLAGYMRASLDLLMTLVLDVEVEAVAAPPPAVPHPHGLVAALETFLHRGVFVGTAVVVEALGLLRLALALPTMPPLVFRFADTVAASLRRWLEEHVLARDHQQHLWVLADIVLATIVGFLRDGVMTNPRGLEAIDGEDTIDWLRRHGASEHALRSPYIMGLYDFSFAYAGGDPARPRLAAGQGMRGGLRMFFSYRGALFWRLRAGMGDVVFAPLYELLKRRGVKFEFFHRLTNVALPPGGKLAPGATSHVAALDFDVQARTRHGGPYAPLIEVGGRPCWPSEPDYAQLDGGDAHADYESHWDRTRVATKRLTVTRDFDFVVLGVGGGAVPYVASELVARDARWAAMVTHVTTVATQAFQLWLKEDVATLGWTGPAGIVTGFAKPFDTWCDMAHVIPEESWAHGPADPARPSPHPPRPATAVYFCSVLPDAAGDDAASYPARRAAEVHDSAVAFLGAAVKPLWPQAYDASGGFRWDLLAAPTPTATTGAARFATQYWRANVNPSERYVQSPPGSLRYRISPLDRTFDNMTIAGDWTDAGFNAGCAETAVMSGRLAAHALSGLPALADIAGYDHP